MSPPWSATDIGDLSGKTAVVTGGNGGLGLSTVRQLLAHGADVIVTSRDVERGQAAVDGLGAQPGTAQVIRLDLADLATVRDFAETVSQRVSGLDLLINNAGIMMTPPQLTADGFESQVGTNHLGHFALTGLLLPFLRERAGSRVVTVSSLAHGAGDITVDNVDTIHEVDGRYTPTLAYGRSKMANLLFTYELQRRLVSNGIPSLSVAAHPGISATNLGAHLVPDRLEPVLRPIFERVVQDADAGALPTLRAATDPHVMGGEYYGPRLLRESRGAPVRVVSNDLSHNAETAARLWDSSQRLTGVSYLS
ncbi:MAG: oxidoreductase [Ornithinimicrobium sp.]